MKMRFLMLVCAAVFAAPVHAATVTISLSGQVLFNGIGDSPLGDINGGDSVTISFNVDSSNFVDGVPGDTRGYVVDQGSFALTSGGVSVGLATPFPGGETPYFTLVDGFPVSDGFFLSTSPVSPGGVPLEQGPYQANFDVGYTGDTLGSLDILDATGDYSFDGLTRFSFSLWAFSPDNAVMEMDFERMAIQQAVIPIPPAMLLFGSALLGLVRFRKR